jgi:hypothetical protein
MRNKNYQILFVAVIMTLVGLQASAAISNPAPGIFVDLGGANNTFGGLANLVVNFLLGIVGIVSLAFIIIGGFRYITSQGDEEAAAAGKKTLTNAIIGLIVVVLSYIIVVVTINALGGSV